MLARFVTESDAGGLHCSIDDRRLLIMRRRWKMPLWCTEGGSDGDFAGVGRAGEVRLADRGETLR